MPNLGVARGCVVLWDCRVDKPLYPLAFRSGGEGEADGLVGVHPGGCQLGDPVQPP